MHYFSYRGDTLFCEDVAVPELAATYGTPLYVYSAATFLHKFNAIRDAFAAVDTTICYSVKCCSNLAVLKRLAQAGASFDIVSGGELFRVLQAGADPQRVVFAGVAKTEKEIRFALDHRILLFNVESEDELRTINRVAVQMGVTAPVALRVNPDVDAKTHRKTTTGKKENKFGIDLETASAIFGRMEEYPNLRMRGIDVHLGSPINSLEPYALGLDRVVAFLEAHPAVAEGIEYIDAGGGFGLLYEDEQVPDFEAYARTIVPRVQRAGKKLILEPGRSIAGNAGLLLGEVQYVKFNGEKTFVMMDAGLNDLIRPAMYDAFHFVWPAKTPIKPASALFADLGSETQADGALIPTDVVGPICESSDVFTHSRMLPGMERGDLVAVFSAGAYGFSMASQYNSHPRAAEVLVEGASHRLIRERETWEDLIRGEHAV